MTAEEGLRAAIRARDEMRSKHADREMLEMLEEDIKRRYAEQDQVEAGTCLYAQGQKILTLEVPEYLSTHLHNTAYWREFPGAMRELAALRVEAELRSKRLRREWPICPYGGTVNLEWDAGNGVNLYYLCNQCGME